MKDATDLKLALGNRAKNIIANGMGLKETRYKKVRCPLHPDKNPSMSWYEEGLMWRCHACSGTIDIYRYLTEFEHMDFKEAINKVAELVGDEVDHKPIKTKEIEYVKPNIKMYELTEPFIQYMAKRKITKQTLDYWGVKQSNWKGTEVYVFSYYQDKELIFVSYRSIGKNATKGGRETNTKSILWGMDNIDKTKPLVITEGQPDAMAVWQSGYKNVVSVPSGASDLKWMEHCWEWLQGIPEFIVFADNDSDGIKMAEAIKTRLHNVKVVTANDRKDANEVLYYDGSEKVMGIINKAINTTPIGLLDLSEVQYKTAMDQAAYTIETGFYEYDHHVEDWKPEELTVIFGRNGEGKTSFISQIIAHCISRGTKTFLYSGEMSETKIQDWLYRQIIGNNKEHLRTIMTKYKDKVEPKPEALQKIKEWHKGKLYLYDRNEEEITGDLDKFFQIMEIAAKKFDVRLFVIDNLMAILEENADSLFSDQANFVQRCKNFAIANKTHVVLLAHPNKDKREIKAGTTGNLEKTDISGSNNIPNKADNIIAVERLWGEDRDCDAIITSLKDRETGQRKVLKYYFSNSTLRFYNSITKQEAYYNWHNKPVEEYFIETSENCPF